MAKKLSADLEAAQVAGQLIADQQNGKPDAFQNGVRYTLLQMYDIVPAAAYAVLLKNAGYYMVKFPNGGVTILDTATGK